jgi:hypothetical protein
LGSAVQANAQCYEFEDVVRRGREREEAVRDDCEGQRAIADWSGKSRIALLSEGGFTDCEWCELDIEFGLDAMSRMGVWFKGL